MHEVSVSLPSMCMDELSIGEIVRALLAGMLGNIHIVAHAIAKRHGKMSRSLLGLIKCGNAGKVNKTIAKETSCQLGCVLYG